MKHNDQDQYANRISLTECRKKLKDDSLSDEQVMMIRDFLYRMLDIEMDIYRKWQENKHNISTPINTAYVNVTKKSVPIHKSEYRRAA